MVSPNPGFLERFTEGNENKGEKISILHSSSSYFFHYFFLSVHRFLRKSMIQKKNFRDYIKGFWGGFRLFFPFGWDLRVSYFSRNSATMEQIHSNLVSFYLHFMHLIFFQMCSTKKFLFGNPCTQIFLAYHYCLSNLRCGATSYSQVLHSFYSLELQHD